MRGRRHSQARWRSGSRENWLSSCTARHQLCPKPRKLTPYAAGRAMPTMPQFRESVPGQLEQTTRLVNATLRFKSSPLGARRAMATIPQFQGSGEVPKRADTLGTPNTCSHVSEQQVSTAHTYKLQGRLGTPSSCKAQQRQTGLGRPAITQHAQGTLNGHTT